ncbi:fructosamine kinase [Rhypophila decipiens]
MTIDPAIIHALNINPASDTEIACTPHGGSGFGASSFKLTVTTPAPDKDNKPSTQSYFLKTGSGPEKSTMFRGEFFSLDAIHSVVPSLCPKPHGWGRMTASEEKFFLLTDFLDLGKSSSGATSSKGKSLSLAQKLAKLHTTPAPNPPGYEKPMFGFSVPTCCGATEQDNEWKESWIEFYAENRLRRVLRQGVEAHGADKELSDLVDVVADKVVPRLLGEVERRGGITPVVIHGDLWSGNFGRGVFLPSSSSTGTATETVQEGNGSEDPEKAKWERVDGQAEEVVYDPASVHGHSEYELGIMKMFGGFSGQFWKEYTELVGKAEPKEEWEDRVALYELYHHLNHFALFGGGYRSGAVGIMRRLVGKYGK